MGQSNKKTTHLRAVPFIGRTAQFGAYNRGAFPRVVAVARARKAGVVKRIYLPACNNVEC